MSFLLSFDQRHLTIFRSFFVAVYATGPAGSDLRILRGRWGGGSGQEFFRREGGGGRVQVRGNFHILTSKKKYLRGWVNIFFQLTIKPWILVPDARKMLICHRF